jgi:hypothetical protein
MTRDEIAKSLELLGLAGEDWGPDWSSYAALKAGWRGSTACPSEAELIAADPAAAIAADQAKRDLAATDADMARVGEDLLSALVSKGVIAETDLPQAARDKIAERRTLRSKL